MTDTDPGGIWGDIGYTTQAGPGNLPKNLSVEMKQNEKKRNKNKSMKTLMNGLDIYR